MTGTDAALQAELSQAVAHGMGASYRPRQVLLVSDLPKTRNMKSCAAWCGPCTGETIRVTCRRWSTRRRWPSCRASWRGDVGQLAFPVI